MRTLLALVTIGLICLVIDGQKQESPRNPIIGQTFDEIVVSSDLNIRRKSKENRQGKALLSNIPSGTTGPPEKSTAFSSRLISNDDIRVAPERREKRETTTAKERYFDFGLAEYLLKSRKR